MESPISRHAVVDRGHYLVYVLHDLSSCAVLVLIPLGLFRGRYDALASSLLISIVTGWLLVGYRARSTSARGHLTRTEVVMSCIVNQGVAVMVLGWLLLGPTIDRGVAVAASSVVALHAAYCGSRCWRLYRDEIAAPSADSFSETTLQLSFTIALPNVVVFTCFALRIMPLDDPSVLAVWLFFECIPGALFSLAHDNTWIWVPDKLTLRQRYAVCFCPQYVWLLVAYSMV